MRLRFLIILLICFAGFRLTDNFAQEISEKKEEYAGKLFGIEVPLGNYYFAKSVVFVFGKQGNLPVQNEQEAEDATWDELLLSFEAFRREIAVSPEELEEGIGKILGGEKVTFNWKREREAYAKWVKEKINQSPELFENQVRHLLQIDKLRKQVIETINPEVTEAEAHEKFVDEYNTLSVELVEFANQKDAQGFYNKVRANPRLWEKEKKKKPKGFKRPGFVSTVFLMDIWKFPREAVAKMIEMPPQAIHPPAGIYQGFGVFKVLEIRRADETQFANLKEQYIEKVKSAKQYSGYEDWLKNLKAAAEIQRYPLNKNQVPAQEKTEQSKS